MNTEIYRAVNAWSDYDRRQLATPPECAGQIVERSYGTDGQYVFQVATDHSTGEVRVAAWRAGDEPIEPWQSRPVLRADDYIGTIECLGCWSVVDDDGCVVSVRSAYVDAMWDADDRHVVLHFLEAPHVVE